MISSFSGDYRFLSNFGEGEIEATFPRTELYHDEGILTEVVTWRSAEAYFQAHKTLSYGEQVNIFKALLPGHAKQLGRHVTLRPDWDQVKRGVMLHVVTLKFLQNPNLATLLAATGAEALVEGNTWNDTYWGAVKRKPGGPRPPGAAWMAPTDLGDGFTDTWYGHNWLGWALMTVRTCYQGDNQSLAPLTVLESR